MQQKYENFNKLGLNVYSVITNSYKQIKLILFFILAKVKLN